MNRLRKEFRVEAMHRPMAAANGHDNGAIKRHLEILGEIDALKHLIAKGNAGVASGDDAHESDSDSDEVITHLKAEMHEAQKLKVELDAMYHAISETKREIASLHSSSFNGDSMSRVTDELDEVVIGTEQATEQILSAVEVIDEDAADLAAQLKGRNRDTVSDIQEKVVNIYEACNFQDLTGQRITKVVNALRFVEERIGKMMEIWGGIDSFKDIETAKPQGRDCDSGLLNGPSLSGDVDVATQDDIDALFA